MLPWYAIVLIILSIIGMWAMLNGLVESRTKKTWPNGQPFTEGDKWADRAVYDEKDLAVMNDHNEGR